MFAFYSMYKVNIKQVYAQTYNNKLIFIFTFYKRPHVLVKKAIKNIILRKTNPHMNFKNKIRNGPYKIILLISFYSIFLFKKYV